MSRYIDEICGGCGLPIKESDDIVVCPECATPQHRECYDKNHACVNEEKHGEDFVWQAQNKPKEQPEEKPSEPTNKAEDNKKQSIVKSITDFVESDDGEELLSEGDRNQIERVLEERSKIVAPGMTPEQEQEMILGHPIKKVMTLVSEKALYYLNKFRAMESGEKFTWNWAAFLFSPFWFFYRKMYKTGIIFLTIRTCISILLSGPLTNIASIYSTLDYESVSSITEEAMRELIDKIMPNLIPIYIGGAAMVVLAIISGIIGNKLYMRKVKSTLDTASASKNRDEYLIRFLKGSSVNPIAVAIAYAAATFLPNIILSFFM